MRKSRLGFTLVELIIVIAVIGVLAAILIPVFSNVIEKANAKSALSDARNAITQYLTEADEKGLPEHITIFVKKGGNFYMFGYNTKGDGRIGVSAANPAKNADDVAELIENYSWNKKAIHGDNDVPAAGVEYDIETDGAFYLIPYNTATETTDSPIKGFHSIPKTKGMEESSGDSSVSYRTLHDELSVNMGDDVYIYHGMLLGGTFEYQSVGGNGGGGTPGGEPGTPTAPTVYTITFAIGNVGGNDSRVTIPAPVSCNEGDIFISGNYSSQVAYDHQEDDDEWYVFDGWDTDSFLVERDTVVTAKWVKYTATKYTLHFDPNGGSLNLATGVSDNMQILAGKDITSYVMNSSATLARHTFNGWSVVGVEGLSYGPDYAGTINMSSDITLKAIWLENKYAVTIDPNNGEETYTLGQYAEGENVALPVAPTKEGFVFDYWKGGKLEIGATGTYTMGGSAIEFKAVWKNNYVLSFYPYDYSGVGDPERTIRAVAGETVTLPTTTSHAKPSEETSYGELTFQFTGWKDTVSGTPYGPGASYTVADDADFTAEFLNVPKFRVTFTAGILEGNSNVHGIPASFTATPTTIVNPNGCTIDGVERGGTPSYAWPGTGSNYVFDGWTPGELQMADETVTFVANWVEINLYKVTFDPGEGNTMPSTLSMTLPTPYGTWTNGKSMPSGTIITDLVRGATPNCADSTKRFTGWKLDGTLYTSDNTPTIVVTKNITLVADYADVKYEVKFVSGAGTGSDYVMGSYTSGNRITMPTAAACSFTAPTGKVLDYWKSSLAESDYRAGAEYTVTDNVTFTAMWADKECTVTLDPNSGTFPTGFQTTYTLTYGATFTTPAGTGITRPLYRFDGWSSRKTGAREYPANTNITVTEDMTLYVSWVDARNLSYAPGTGASGSMKTFVVDYNIPVTVLSFTDSQLGFTLRSGYEFVGWKYNGTIYQPGDTYTPTANATLTAQYEVTTCTVTYNANGGKFSDNSTTKTATVNKNTAYTLLTSAAYTPTKSGYTFKGWGTSSTATSTVSSITPTDDTTVYAVWEESGRSVTVSFYDTWNEETAKTVTVNVSGNTLDYSAVSSQAPTYWVQGSTTTVSISTDNKATFNGDRHNKSVSGDTGTDYQVLTTLAGLTRVSGVASSSQTTYPTEAEARATMSRNYWMLNNILFSDNKVWDPIGWTTGNDVSFSGKFDGNNKQIGGTVSGVTSGGLLQMNFETVNCNHLGLFAQIDGANAKVSNLYVCLDVIVADSYIGGIAGELFKGTISNCAVWANKFEGSNLYSNTGIVGGIVGRNNDGTIEKCASVVMDVDAINWSGGIAGQNFGTIDQCYALGGCNANYRTYINDGSLSTYYAGGIVGGNKGTVSNCFARPVYYVCATNYIGGICGINYSGATLQNCWNDNNSKCLGASNANIFCGSQSGSVSNCYTVSTTTGTANGAQKITASALKKKTSISGWSTSIWSFNTTSQYPTLKNITVGPNQLTNLSI